MARIGSISETITRAFITSREEKDTIELIPSQSELFRCIPISVSETMLIIPNQSEKRFVSRLMKNSKKSIRPNPI